MFPEIQRVSGCIVFLNITFGKCDNFDVYLFLELCIMQLRSCVKGIAHWYKHISPHYQWTNRQRTDRQQTSRQRGNSPMGQFINGTIYQQDKSSAALFANDLFKCKYKALRFQLYIVLLLICGFAKL